MGRVGHWNAPEAPMPSDLVPAAESWRLTAANGFCSSVAAILGRG
jgi:hypothetical protein